MKRKAKRKRKLASKRFRHRLIAAAIALLLLCGIVRLIYLIVQPIVLNDTTVEVEVDQNYDPKSNLKYVFLGDESQVTVAGQVNTKKAGDYTITYQYHDKEKTATVHVYDDVKPKLTVQNYTTDTVEEVKAKRFVQSVKDNSKVTTTADIENDANQTGTYKVTVTAKDAYGNQTTKTCKLIRKKDKKAPTISNVRTTTLLSGEKLDTSDVKVKDNYDDDPDLKLDDSDVNYKKAGKYTAVYTATDRSGNTSKKKQKVRIVTDDTEKYDKIVYLTFDDGPSANTSKILKILKKYDAKATFFVTGTGEEYNDEIRKAYEQGNSIGLHTYSHDYSIYSTEKTYLADLKKISKLVEEETGEKSTIMRFPGGSSNTINENYTSDGQNIMPTLIEDVENMGYEYYDWNVDSQDASGNNVSVSVIVSNATSSDESYVNILMHDSGSKSTTVEALPKIIKYYKKKGYVFLPITKGSYVVHHQGVVDEASDDTGTTDTSTDTGTDEETAAAQ